MSFVHHEPDPRRAPCLGCNERIAAQDLQRADHSWMSTYFWHPYHFWCVRPRHRHPHPYDRCADCDAPLELAEIRAAIHWAATFPQRLLTTTRGKWFDASRFVARPRGLFCVSVVSLRPRVELPPRPPPLAILGPEDKDADELVRTRYELVHDACPVGDVWRDQLRAHPDDADLREVYADRLESDGDLERAAFVRTDLQRRRTPAAELDTQLRVLRGPLPASWVRDVCLTSRTRIRAYAALSCTRSGSSR